MILLVVDMQKGIVDEGLYAFAPFLDKTVRLIRAARENHVEVVFVQHDAGPGSGLTAGDSGFEIVDQMRPEPGEKVFVKTINSCFGSNAFREYAERRKDKRLMIIGLQTNYCIDATVKSAFERGFQVIIPEGANSTFDNDYMTGETAVRYYQEDVWEGLADVVSFEEAMSLLAQPGDGGAAAGDAASAAAQYEIRNKGIRLVRVSAGNFDELLRLSVDEAQQDFVAPNAYSLAEAYAVLSEGRFVQAFGVYDGDAPVGFAMIGHNSFRNPDCPKSYQSSYYFWRFMVDRRYQGRGYGKDAVKLVLDYIRSFPDGEEKACCVSYEPHNAAAKALYAFFGFVPNGETDGDEEIAVLPLK